MTFVLSAQPIDAHGVIGFEDGGNPIEFETVEAFAEWIGERKPGEAWDLTLTVNA